MKSFKTHLEEARVTPGDLKAQAEGKKAARQGVKYDENPYEKGSSRHLQWSKGHNAARARMKEEVEQIDEISAATKASYLKKADKDSYDMFTGKKPGSKEKMDKRRAAIQKVSKELEGKKKLADYNPKTKQYTREEVEQVDEARGTAAKYADRQGMMGGKYTAMDHSIGSDAGEKWRERDRAKRRAQANTDPGGVRKGLGTNVVDTDKATAKAKKKGLTGDQIRKAINWKNTNSVMKPGRLPEEVEQVEESYMKHPKYRALRSNMDDASNKAAKAYMAGNRDEGDKHKAVEMAYKKKISDFKKQF